jgi:hypothetical protein
MNFTTPRIVEQYDNIAFLLGEKIITKKVFNEQKKLLVAEQKKINERNEKARAKREALREAERAKEIARQVAIAEAKAKASRERANERTKYIRNTLSKSLTLAKGQKITLTLADVYEKIDINTLLKNIIKKSMGQKYVITVGNTNYTVSDSNREKLLKLIMEDLVITEEYTMSDGSLVQELNEAPYLTIENLADKHKNIKSNGAFFKYNHTLDTVDFSRYAVYHTNQQAKYDDTCLLYALKMGGLDEQVLQSLKIYVKNRNIPLCDIEEICNKAKICIYIKRPNVKHLDRTTYGKEYENKFNIGLIDDHYFLIEDCGITSYAITNYEQIKEQKDFKYIIGTNQAGSYKRDKTRTISSYDAIKIMYDNKDTMLKEMSFSNSCIASTQFYDKINDTIENLEYDEDICCKPSWEQKKKSDRVKYNNVFFDFETYTNKDNVHIPYLVRTYDGINSKVLYGEECGLYMLCSLTSNTRLIAHNANYDYRFLIKYLRQINELSRGSRLIGLTAMFKKLYIEVKDSFHLISMPLRKFSKVFGLPFTKEIMPYELYKKETIEQKYINIQYVLDNFIDNNDHKQFLDNIEKWNLRKNDCYDILEYSSRYCEIDCKVLYEGYNTFNKWMQEGVNIDINSLMTIASLAHKYFVNTGCYNDVYSLSGIPQMFIQGSVVGGRTMVSNNTKISIKQDINDFDAVSLYPSAMYRMDGFLKGKPKVITNFNYDWLKTQDGYFVDILIKSVGKNYSFPLMSAKNDHGIRMFSNDMVGKTIRVDRYTLEDLIEFQEITFDVIRGYYFNEGFNTTIKSTIEFLFNERLKKKKEGNPSQEIYKLIMNSGYGKSIMKPVESDVKIFDDANEFDVYLTRNYNWITSYSHFGNKTKVKSVKTLNDHFNIAHIGVCILSMSKRIMNEVMCLAENKGIQLYYQDTDSIHIKDCDISKLSVSFTEKYNRVLIGKQLGQFHSDFEIDGCTNILAKRSIFLGKKSYIDELQGVDKNGNTVIDYHIRMKGIPNSVILHTANKLGYNNPFELYEDLYKGKLIEFDLTNDGSKCNFKMNKDYTVKTLDHFIRKIKF